MTSHDLSAEEIRKLLAADRKKAHVHVYDHTYALRNGVLLNYCMCGAWEPDEESK